MILIIDNYDSFTYNLYQYVGELGYKAMILRNDKVDKEIIKSLDISHIIISPGPKAPIDAGNSLDIIKSFYRQIPILGICLGHQCIGHVFGMKIEVLQKPVHGKSSRISHDNKSIFESIPNDFKAIRYHSLVVRKDLDTELEVAAISEDNEIMALRHKDYNLHGLQFHPESIGSEYGREILRNFLEIEEASRR